MRLKTLSAFAPLLLVAACSSSTSNPDVDVPKISCKAITSATSCTVTYAMQPATQADVCTQNVGSEAFVLNAGSGSYGYDSNGVCEQTFNGCDMTRDCTIQGTTSHFDFTFTATAAGSTIAGTATAAVPGTNCTYAVTGSCVD